MKFKHELYLIERTKLLEGTYCQSLTFTNPKGNVYTKEQRSAMSSFYAEETGDMRGDRGRFCVSMTNSKIIQF